MATLREPSILRARPAPPSRRTRLVPALAVGVAVVVALSVAGCAPAPTPAPTGGPGTPDHPRPLPIVTKDYTFVPAPVDVVPGETVLLQVVNGGLVVHEAVIGPSDVQDAWEAAEAPTASTPPGPTTAVSVPPGLEGVRVVVGSGERRDVTWTVPADAASTPGGWFVGCHIPGHWALGMVVPVRFVTPDGSPLPAAGAGSLAADAATRADGAGTPGASVPVP